MSYDFQVTRKEKEYLRELARKQLEYASLPVMEKRKKLWYDHNSLQGERPVIVMEMRTFEDDMLPELRCKSGVTRKIEKNMLHHIVNYEMVNDDKIIPPYYTVTWKIDITEFGLEIDREYAEDKNGKKIGYSDQHPLNDLKKDFSLLNSSEYRVDRKYTLVLKEFIENIIGDILPVKIKNKSLNWFVTPSQKVVHLMGLEQMMYSMMDYPEELHKLFSFINDEILSFVRWQEEEGLLTLNNGNDYAGSGSYGFTDELPTETCKKSGEIKPKDLWLNMNSQETVGVSPEMFGEFIFPYYYELAQKFGLVYYGCCEPVHDIWDDYISKLPHLRKVSISPWCDEEYMGEVLQDADVIYSRKPSPNYIGVGEFDEAAFTEHITHTLKAAKDCSLEIIFRDIYSLNGQLVESLETEIS
ncbi:MAG: hypothetical protein ACOCV3_07450, partial [Halanaerobiales bacterium]